MPNKSLLLLLFLFLSCALRLFAQDCRAVITPNGPLPICQGDPPVVLVANAGAGLSYQWLQVDPVTRVETDIAGATNDTLLVSQTGIFRVRVSGLACNTAASTQVSVTVNPLPNRPDFFLSPNIPECAGTPIEFTISNPQPGEIYVWDFGDGGRGSGDRASHTYQATGGGTATFDVKVYSVGSGGCRSQVNTQPVSVKRMPAFTAPRDSANFNVCIPDDQDTISVRAVLFNTTPPSVDIFAYLVDFGDGAGEQTFLPEQFTATTPIRSLIPYDTTGTFPITIRARGSNDCETVFTRNYQVNKKPEAKFTANKDRVSPTVPPKNCIPVKVTVDSDSTTGGNVTYKWSVKNNTGQDAGASDFRFIEGTSDTSAAPVMQFDISGRYNLELIVTNSCGSDTTSQSLLIGYPEVRLNADTTSCGPTTIFFSDELVNIDPNLGTIIEDSYEWVVTGTGGAIFVNGTTAKSRNPRISFPNPGEYKVRVRVSNECGFSDVVAQQSAEATITVNPIPPAPEIAGTGTTVCAGDTTSIRPDGPGTNFAFYSTQTGGSPFFTGRAYNPGPLTADATYYVATMDAKGCVSTTRTRFNIDVVEAISNNTISLNQNQTEVCAGQPITQSLNGGAARGGNGTIEYLWQISQSGNAQDFADAPGTNSTRTYSPPPLNSTTYFRRLVMAGACRPDTSNVISIRVTPPITNNTINVVSGGGSVVCEGQTGPMLTGSQPAGTVVIVWESSTSGANATDFTPAPGVNRGANYDTGVLSRTTWFRRRLTSGGCTDISPALEITVNPIVNNNTISDNQIICSGTIVPDPLIGSIPRGGNSTFTYLWEISLTGNASDFRPAPGTNNQSNYLPTTISQTTWFRRTVTSGNCAPALSNEVELTFVPPIENNAIMVNQVTVCAGTVPELTGTAGNRSVVFLWESSTTSATTGFNPAPGDNNGRNYTPPFINQNTWYRRTVRPRDTSCEPTPSNAIAVTVAPIPAAPRVEAASVEICQGGSATLRAVGNGGTYEWYTVATGGIPVFYGPEFLTYPITDNTTFYVQIESENKCVSATRTPVTVTVTSISADAGRDTTLIEGQTIALLAKGGTQYLWSPAAGLNDVNIPNPVAMPTKTTTYRVEVTNELGCKATDEVTITVIPRVRVVNTFSPNQDGINETWEIEHIERYPNATVEIFNRWGNPIFKSSGAYQPWDGTFKGSPLPLATYYYIIRLDKNEKPISGSVTIVR